MKTARVHRFLGGAALPRSLAARGQSAMLRVAVLIVARDRDIEGRAQPFGLL